MATRFPAARAVGRRRVGALLLVTLMALVALATACGGGADARGHARPRPPADSTAGVAVRPAAPAPASVTAAAPAYARLYAGLTQEAGSPLTALDGTREVATHRDRIAGGWATFDRDRFDPMRRWAERELAAPSRRTVFYPFAGPDAATPLALFPTGTRYVMVGLEPPGRLIPDDSAAGALRQLPTIEKALRTVMAIGFFRTNEIAVDLDSIGVAPVLAAMATRSGFTVVDWRPLAIDSAGRVGAGTATDALQPARARRGNGVELTLRAGDGRSAVLQYFAMDLSDDGLQRLPRALQALEQTGPLVTVTKATSYLLHKPHFARLRGVILRQSDEIVQDDSGIPWRMLTARAGWTPTLYGTYVDPIPMFIQWRQEELVALSRQGAERPLPFAFGYRHQKAQAGLIVAVRTEPR